jgi:hypothetical protein
MTSETRNNPGLTWEGVDLPRVTPGDYRAVCINWQGPAWVRAFRRWSVRLEFSLLADGTRISGFYNLGSDTATPHIGRRSRFYAVWLETFTEAGLLYTVRVANAAKDERAADKPDALVYSRVTDVLRVERK